MGEVAVMRKWNKPVWGGILAAALVVVVLAAVIIGRGPKLYAEAEITPELCARLAPYGHNTVVDEDWVPEVLEIRRVDDTIIAVYGWEQDWYAPYMPIGYLRFVPAGEDKYRLAANRVHNMMIDAGGYGSCVDCFTTHDAAGNLQPYYIYLGSYRGFGGLEVYEREGEEERLLERFEFAEPPYICIWQRPEAGRYVELAKEGRQSVSRYWAVTQVTDRNADLEFWLDWGDIWEGQDGDVACRLTLLDKPDKPLRNMEVALLALPQCGWLSAIPVAVTDKLLWGRDVAKSGQYNAWRGQKVSLPVEFDYTYEGLNFMQGPSGSLTWVINLQFAKGIKLKQPGDFVEAIAEFADYGNEPQAPADMEFRWSVPGVCQVELTVQGEILSLD